MTTSLPIIKNDRFTVDGGIREINGELVMNWIRVSLGDLDITNHLTYEELNSFMSQLKAQYVRESIDKDMGA